MGNRLDYRFRNTISGWTISHQVRTSYISFARTNGTLYYYCPGESILGVVVGLAGHEWDIYSSLSVGLGLSIPFSLWWIYFDNIGGSAIRAATEKGRRGIYYIWLYIHFPLVVGLTAIGIGIKQVASSNQEIPLPFSDLWLICGSVSGCLFVQAILHLVAVEDSDIEPKTRRKWATYRIISGIFIISIAILGLRLLPVVLMFILAFICALQIVLDLRDRPHHRIFKLWCHYFAKVFIRHLCSGRGFKGTYQKQTIWDVEGSHILSLYCFLLLLTFTINESAKALLNLAHFYSL